MTCDERQFTDVKPSRAIYCFSLEHKEGGGGSYGECVVDEYRLSTSRCPPGGRTSWHS